MKECLSDDEISIIEVSKDTIAKEEDSDDIAIINSNSNQNIKKDNNINEQMYKNMFSTNSNIIDLPFLSDLSKEERFLNIDSSIENNKRKIESNIKDSVFDSLKSYNEERFLNIDSSLENNKRKIESNLKDNAANLSKSYKEERFLSIDNSFESIKRKKENNLKGSVADLPKSYKEERFLSIDCCLEKVKENNSKKNLSIKIIDHEEEKILNVCDEDTFEEMHKEFCGDDPLRKMTFKGLPISKYLTIKDLGITNCENTIYITGPRRVIKDLNIINIKINTESGVINMNVNRTYPCSEIINFAKKEFTVGDYILVLNGKILNSNDIIFKVIRPDDAVDLLSKDDINLKNF